MMLNALAEWSDSVLKQFEAMISQASGSDVFGIMLLLEDSFDRIMNKGEK